MGKTLILDLTDDEFGAVEQAARAEGATPVAWAARIIRAYARSNGDRATAMREDSPTEGTEVPLKSEEKFRAEYEAISRCVAEREAARLGGTVDEHLAHFKASIAPKPMPKLTEEERSAAFERMARHFGSVSSGDPNSADNDRIDADLAREYARDLEVDR